MDDAHPDNRTADGAGEPTRPSAELGCQDLFDIVEGPTDEPKLLLGLRGGRHANRPELVELYGFDTKFAMHMVRLGVQGAELLGTGRITLPLAEPWLSWFRALRRGERSEQEALEAAADLTDGRQHLSQLTGSPSRKVGQSLGTHCPRRQYHTASPLSASTCRGL